MNPAAVARKPESPILLHLPFPLLLLGAGIWIGYRSYDHDDFGFGWPIVAAPLLVLALGVAIASTGMVITAASPGRTALAASRRAFIVVLALCLIPKAIPLGHRFWEQHLLGPRAGALKRFVAGAAEGNHQPVTIDGYAFDAWEQTPEGALFYTLERGGPFSSSGIFVPFAEDYRGLEPPEEGRPSKAARATPTSVPGMFWFVTKD